MTAPNAPDPRAPSTPGESAATGRKARGRPRLALSEEALGAALEAGKTYEDVAAANKISPRTVRRRVSDARARHGAAWGRPKAPPEPEPPPIDLSAPEPTHAELVSLAQATLITAMRCGKPAERLAAAKIVFTTPPPVAPPPELEESREALRARVHRATASAAPEPTLAVVLELDTSDTDRANVSERVTADRPETTEVDPPRCDADDEPDPPRDPPDADDNDGGPCA